MTRAGSKDRAGLEQAVERLTTAAEAIPPTRPERATALSALGMAEMQLCELDAGEGTATLDHAIAILMAALNASHPNAPGTAAVLHALGKTFWRRYDRTHLVSDLDNATRALSEAVRLTPEGLAELTMYLNDLAIVASERFFTAEQLDLAKLQPAVDALERAWSLVETSFATDSVVYQVGDQWQAMNLGIAERLVTFYAHLPVCRSGRLCAHGGDACQRQGQPTESEQDGAVRNGQHPGADAGRHSEKQWRFLRDRRS
jgi:hypothetical protein